MALQTVWYFTDISETIIDSIEQDLFKDFSNMDESQIGDGSVNSNVRNSKQSWVPSDHWSAGFIWHYISRANRENFLYDIDHIDGESLQYTQYSVGEYYNWHNDSSISQHYKPQGLGNINDYLISDHLNKSIEKVRKLSFSLLLSNPEDYDGGNVEFLDDLGNTYIAPRQRGVMLIFDSRTQHRVTEVTNGVRKSLVGWVVGNRWK
jgi:PKHD-type hydroxylase